MPEANEAIRQFYRIESSRDPDAGGVGLGLYVTRSINLEHGGDIVLVNRKGGGLSVRLELPTGPGLGGSDHKEVRNVEARDPGVDDASD
jgi:signal transduction histidine kinase